MSNKDLKFWNKTAKLYTKFMKNNDLIYNEIINKIIDLFKGNEVLEIGCGTGQFSISLSKVSSSYIATDYSINMINEFKNNYNGDSIEFMVEDITNLSFPDNKFDIVLIPNVLHVLKDYNKALEEAFRVLKPNGILIAPTFIYDKKMPFYREVIINLFGFKPYNKWKSSELIKIVEDSYFSNVKGELIIGKPLSECLIIAQKIVKGVL